MIFENIDFHNVEDMQKIQDGYKMWRLPESVRSQVNDGIKNWSAGCSTGVELRFKLREKSADIWLRAEPTAEAQTAHLYYGSIQGGHATSSYVIGTEPTKIHIEKPDNIEALWDVTKKTDLPFSPEVFRLVLPYGSCVFIKAEGDIEPPQADDVPKVCYLAYGSSITHGSLALVMPYSYPFRIAQRLKCDYINLGFPGTAQMEPVMAEYIVSRKDWTFASVEMGINTLDGEWTAERFEANIDAFTSILAADGRPVFATSIFGFNGGGEKADLFRSIVKKYAEPRLRFIDGLEILNNPAYIAQDMVHPTLEGIEQIVDRFGGFIGSGI